MGTCCVSLLVGAGLWYADSRETVRWPSTFAGAESETQVTSTLAAVRRIEWSADGQKIISLSQGALCSGECLAMHDAIHGSGAMPIDVAGEPVGAMALSPDSRHLAVTTYCGKLLWIDLDSSNTVALVDDVHSNFTAAAISADGRLLAAADARTGSIYVCSPAQGTMLRLTVRRQSSVSVLRFSEDGRRLISAHNDGSICHWDLATQAVLNELAGNSQPVTAVEFLPGDQRIISTGVDGAVRIRNLDSSHEEWSVESGDAGISTLAMSPDGRTAAWGGYNRRIVVWDLELNEKKFEFKFPAPVVSQLKFAPDGTTLAVAGRGAMIRLYDMRSGTEKEGIHVGRSL
jgi:WD40 repeat protein